MKKRVLSLLLSLVLCLGMLPGAALAADSDFVIDEYGYLSKYIGLGGDVVIPEGVTQIGYHAFYGCTNVTSVIIPDGVLSLGYEAFANCTSLASVTVPNSLWFIEGDAFDGTPWLESLGEFAIANRTLLRYQGEGGDVVIPDGVTRIGDRAFDGCGNLTGVTIPEGVTQIGNYAFRGCTGLTNVTIPGRVTYISDGTFSGCTSLTNVVIPDSVTTIGVSAFDDTPFLRNLGEFAIINGILFRYQGIGGDVVIPDGVTYINLWAFYDDVDLTSVTIPNSVTAIDQQVFEGCTSLTSVTILNRDAEIDVIAFYRVSPTIYAPAGGAVEAYCKDWNIPFVALETSATEPEAPAEPAIPASGTAYTGTQAVWVGDGAVTLHAYILRDEKGNDMNFVKIRDVAAILNGTAAQFDIGWDGSINLEVGKPYTTVTGAELTQVFQGDQPYKVGSYPVNVNGAPVSLTTIILTDSGEGEHNYVKLRDLAEALNFNVTWTAETGITLQPDQPYVKPSAPSM